MVRLVRAGQSQRSVAQQFGVSLGTVQLWLRRAGDAPLEKVNWGDASHAPRNHPNQTPQEIERKVLEARKRLQQSDLGEFGAQAIHTALLEQGVEPVPSVTTIHRILRREGAYDKPKRIRRPPPVKGWYLPEVARAKAEIDETDFVEALFLDGSPQEYFALNTLSLHSGFCASWLTQTPRTDFVLERLLSHWRTFGLPDYAQFDNGKAFSGPHLLLHSLGRVIRLCLSLEVVPVFSIPSEFGIQSAIESYNNRWQQKVWQRFTFLSLAEAQAASDRYVQAARQKVRLRSEQAPQRRPFPSLWQEPKSIPAKGRLVLLRRANAGSVVEVFGRSLTMKQEWSHRLVRCEMDIATKSLSVFGLRRATPEIQPLLGEWNFSLQENEQEILLNTE